MPCIYLKINKSIISQEEFIPAVAATLEISSEVITQLVAQI